MPALDGAIKLGKEIRFSHAPRAYGDCALADEWNYIMLKCAYTDLIKRGDFWYGVK